jgi:hypothetical protein
VTGEFAVISSGRSPENFKIGGIYIPMIFSCHRFTPSPVVWTVETVASVASAGARRQAMDDEILETDSAYKKTFGSWGPLQ